MVGMRPDKPRRRLPGITATWSGGEWKWRAVWREGGEQKRGPVRVSQEEAYDDFRLHVPAGGGVGVACRLDDALERVAKDAEARGLPVQTVKSYRTQHKTILRFWSGSSDIRACAVDEVVWMIGKARENLAPPTVRMLLWHLHRAFRALELRSPVPEALRRTRASMRARSLQPRPITMAEVDHHLGRIRAYPGQRASDGRWITCPQKERDADLFELFAFTGIRAGELSRVLVRDVDLEARRIDVREPKDRGNPRSVPIPERLRGPLQRLLAGKKPHQRLAPDERILNRRCEVWKARLGEPRWNRRQLRHAYATGLLESGATLAEVRDLLGHRTLSPVTTRYLHARGARLDDAVSRLAEHAASPQLHPTPDGPPSTHPSPTEAPPGDVP